MLVAMGVVMYRFLQFCFFIFVVARGSTIFMLFLLMVATPSRLGLTVSRRLEECVRPSRGGGLVEGRGRLLVPTAYHDCFATSIKRCVEQRFIFEVHKY